MDSFESQLMAPVTKRVHRPENKKTSSEDGPKKPTATPQPKPPTANDGMFDPAIFKRHERPKVYAGRKRHNRVPTLLATCQHSILQHIAVLTVFEETPIELLDPVLRRCSVSQLATITLQNPKRSNELLYYWSIRLEREFNIQWFDAPIQQYPPKAIKWDKVFEQLEKEREEKLNETVGRIAERAKERAAPIKRVIVSETLTPKFIKRRQERNGIIIPKMPLPTPQIVSRRRRELANTGSYDGIAKLAAVNGVGRGGHCFVMNARCRRALAMVTKPRVAPLMARVRQMARQKMRQRR